MKMRMHKRLLIHLLRGEDADEVLAKCCPDWSGTPEEAAQHMEKDKRQYLDEFEDDD